MTAVKGDKHPNMIGNQYAKGLHEGRPRMIELSDLKPYGETLVEWAEDKYNELMAETNKELKMPFFMRSFAREQKTSLDTLSNYCKQDKDFFGCYKKAMEIITEALVVGGAKGWWNPKVFAFIAMNETAMVMKSQTDLTSGGLAITGVEIAVRKNTNESEV